MSTPSISTKTIALTLLDAATLTLGSIAAQKFLPVSFETLAIGTSVNVLASATVNIETAKFPEETHALKTIALTIVALAASTGFLYPISAPLTIDIVTIAQLAALHGCIKTATFSIFRFLSHITTTHPLKSEDEVNALTYQQLLNKKAQFEKFPEAWDKTPLDVQLAFNAKLTQNQQPFIPLSSIKLTPGKTLTVDHKIVIPKQIKKFISKEEMLFFKGQKITLEKEVTVKQPEKPIEPVKKPIERTSLKVKALAVLALALVGGIYFRGALSQGFGEHQLTDTTLQDSVSNSALCSTPTILKIPTSNDAASVALTITASKANDAEPPAIRPQPKHEFTKETINSFSDEGFTPLIIAIIGNKLDLLPEFFSLGANVNLKSNDGLSPLHWAAQLNNKEALSLLLKENADTSAIDLDQNTPLHTAVGSLNVESTKMLLEKEKSLNTQNLYGETPLYLAIDRFTEIAEKRVNTHGAYSYLKEIMVFGALPAPTENDMHTSQKALQIVKLIHGFNGQAHINSDLELVDANLIETSPSRQSPLLRLSLSFQLPEEDYFYNVAYQLAEILLKLNADPSAKNPSKNHFYGVRYINPDPSYYASLNPNKKNSRIYKLLQNSMYSAFSIGETYSTRPFLGDNLSPQTVTKKNLLAYT